MKFWCFFELFIIFCSFHEIIKCDEITKKNSTMSKESARFVPAPPPFLPPLLYATNAATGILAAIAVPLTDLDNQNVFVSYNFEMNYNMPYCPRESFPGPLIRFPSILGQNTTVGPEGDGYNPHPRCELDKLPSFTLNSGGRHARGIQTSDATLLDKIVFSRKSFYQLIEHRLYSSGIEGKKCLLLAICEASKYSFETSNGVIGQIFHVMLTPSSSMDEKLPPEFMKAEKFGNIGDCRKYEAKCNVNILEIFTRIIE